MEWMEELAIKERWKARSGGPSGREISALARALPDFFDSVGTGSWELKNLKTFTNKHIGKYRVFAFEYSERSRLKTEIAKVRKEGIQPVDIQNACHSFSGGEGGGTSFVIRDESQGIIQPLRWISDKTYQFRAEEMNRLRAAS